MVIMNLLRMLVDVSFYCTFAGLIAVKCGGSGAFVGALIQCLCFGLSHLGGSKRPLRLLFLLPMAVCWGVYRHSPADGILLIPTAAYIIWLVWKNDYVLNHERQQRLFGVFWKMMCFFVPMAMLMGAAAEITAVSVPYALVMLICSVMLMRALRHEPKVYCQKKYQVINISAVVFVTAVAGLLSTKTFLNGCVLALKTVYGALFQPILEFLLYILICVIAGIGKLFSWLPFGIREREPQEVEQMDASGIENILGEDIQLIEPGALVRVLGFVLLGVAAAVALVLFFRWMNRRRDQTGMQGAAREVRETIAARPRNVKKKETSPVRKIRAQYRGFLKWSAGLGVEPERSSTSLDIHQQVSRVSGREEVSSQIREIYIQARYAEIADRDSVQTMKQLCDQVKKSDAEQQ